jgi:hypothetical protein
MEALYSIVAVRAHTQDTAYAQCRVLAAATAATAEHTSWGAFLLDKLSSASCVPVVPVLLADADALEYAIDVYAPYYESC